MEPAQCATGADPQFGVQMQEMLAVTDYPLFQPQGQRALVGIAALAVKEDGEGRKETAARDRACLPSRLTRLLDQGVGAWVNRARYITALRRWLAIQHIQNVGPRGIHAGRVGNQIAEHAHIADEAGPEVAE